MARGLEVLLEAAPGSAVPSECFASVRPAEAKVSAGPCVPCATSEATFLGRALDLASRGVAGGSVVVDIYRHVGSISVSLAPGALSEASLLWPGLAEEVRLRVTVGATEVTPPVSPMSLPTPGGAAADFEPLPGNVPQALSQDRALDGSDTSGAETPRKGNIAAEPSVSPSLQWSPREEPQKHYKPVAINDCDQIIPYLFLGGIAAASDTQQLVQQGIRAVCCCVRELEFPTSEFSKEVEYYRVDVEDISREPIDIFFPEATEFIHAWLSREQPVLVHCRAGVSRSASVVLAYLIAYHGYSLHDAFFLVRSHRSIVTPNIGFMEKLGEFEEAKRGTEPTIEINKYVAWYTTPERAAVPDLKPD